MNATPQSITPEHVGQAVDLDSYFGTVLIAIAILMLVAGAVEVREQNLRQVEQAAAVSPAR